MTGIGGWPRNLTVLLFLIVTVQPLGGGAWINVAFDPQRWSALSDAESALLRKGGRVWPSLPIDRSNPAD